MKSCSDVWHNWGISKHIKHVGYYELDPQLPYKGILILLGSLLSMKLTDSYPIPIEHL